MDHGKVHFNAQDEAPERDVPAKQLIHHALTYARELERIV